MILLVVLFVKVGLHVFFTLRELRRILLLLLGRLIVHTESKLRQKLILEEWVGLLVRWVRFAVVLLHRIGSLKRETSLSGCIRILALNEKHDYISKRWRTKRELEMRGGTIETSLFTFKIIARDFLSLRSWEAVLLVLLIPVVNFIWTYNVWLWINERLEYGLC